MSNVDVKALQATQRRLSGAMRMMGKAFNFTNKLKTANAVLKGKKIATVTGVEGEYVKITCDDGTEFIARAVSRPGIHYERDSRTVVSVEVGAGRTSVKLIDK